MPYRMLGVAFALCLGAANVAAEDLTIGTAQPHAAPEPSMLVLFALGVALLGIAFVRRRSERPRDRKN